MKHLLTLILLGTIANLGIGQDLIERTRKDIKFENLISPNVIAKGLKTLKVNELELNLFSINSQLKANAYSEYTDDAIYLDISTKTLRSITNKKSDYLQLAVPVTAERSFNLILEKVEVLSPTYKMETSDGRIIYPDRSDIMFYRGIVEGDVQSIAVVSIVHGKFRALLSDKDGNYIIGELPKEKGKFALYNDRTLKKSLGEYCKTDDLTHSFGKNLFRSSQKNEKSVTSPCVPVYVEADFATFQSHGSESNVESFIMSLISQVAAVYVNNTGMGGSNASISISLSSTFVWTTQDSYNSNIGLRLEEFGELRKDNYDGRLAHLISTEPLGGGIAWLDVLCDNYFTYQGDLGDGQGNVLHHLGPYAVSADMGTSVNSYPVYSWETMVFSHEMGHNFGSPHTHNCSWAGGAIDNCFNTEGNCSVGNDPGTTKGTIMSYCHICEEVSFADICSANVSNCASFVPNCPNPGISIANGFGPLPGQLIFTNYSNASCTLECSEDDIPGCTDPNSCNYNSNATVDDGSCDYSCFGCMDNTACNYDSGATMDDGSCDFSCYGCINMMACNYDNMATIDDGSCEFTSCVGCMTAGSHNYDPNATMAGTCETCTDSMLNGDEVQVDCGGALCAPCPCTFSGNVVFNNQTLNSDNTTITSGNVISTNNTVTIQGNSTDVIWQSTQSVQLNPNFTMNSGTLLINVEDCEP